MHISSFDRSCEILLCHSQISAETSTSVTLTWCINTLKLIRMLKYKIKHIIIHTDNSRHSKKTVQKE